MYYGYSGRAGYSLARGVAIWNMEVSVIIPGEAFSRDNFLLALTIDVETSFSEKSL
jgi:hypothetical protein